MRPQDAPGYREKRLDEILRACRKTKDGCIEWTKSITREGYSQVSYKARRYSGHRLMWILHRGDPGKLFVCHKCDNRKCLNIDHLFLGTIFDNQRDAVEKGRYAGQKQTHCKRGHEFTEENTIHERRGHRGQRGCRTCAKMSRQRRTIRERDERNR